MDLQSQLDKLWNSIKPIPAKLIGKVGDFLHQDSMIKTVVLVMLVISILPVMMVGTVSYIRTRSQIRNLVSGQLVNLVENTSSQLVELSKSRSADIDRLVSDPRFANSVEVLNNPAASQKDTSSARLNLLLIVRDIVQGPTTTATVFDQMLVMGSDGTILAASSSSWTTQVFGSADKISDPFILSLLGQDATQVYFNPLDAFENRNVLTTLRTYKTGSGATVSIIAFTASPLFQTVIEQSNQFFPGAQSILVTSDQKFTGAGKGTTLLTTFKDPSTVEEIKNIPNTPKQSRVLNYRQDSGKQIIGYARFMPDLNAIMLLQLPQDIIFRQVPIFDILNFLLLVIALATALGLAYYSSTTFVTPIVALTRNAEEFAKGNLKVRSNLHRRDEIGILGSSFDHMAEELNNLYLSLEEKVEQRTSQLRTASEVAQLAISSNDIDETIEKVVAMVRQRFDYYTTSLYLTDQTGTFEVLREISGEAAEIIKNRNERISFSSETLIGWVARTNHSRTIGDTQDPLFKPDDVLPELQSEAAVPISIGNQVLGILDVKSKKAKTFDSETIFVLQTLANQLAAALQNIRLLETTQVNLEETSLLYRVTRQVTEAHDETEVLKLLIDSQPEISHTNAILTLDGVNLHILGLYDPRNNKFERNLQTIDIPSSPNIAQLSTGDPIFFEDVSKPGSYNNLLSFFMRRGCHSAAIFPCIQNGKVSKVIALGFREEDHITQAVLQPFNNLAEVVSATLEKFQVLHTLQQRLTELQILANFSQVTSAETNLNRLYQVLHNQVMDTMGSDISFMVVTYDAVHSMIQIPYAYENTQYLAIPPFPLGQGLTSYIIEKRSPLLLNKNAAHQAQELGAKVLGQAAKSWLGVPLVAGGEVIGALILQDIDHEERFNDNDLNLFMTLAPQIATSIRNAKLVDEMEVALHAYDQERLMLNTMLGNLPDAIFFKDKDGRYIRVSESIAQMFNLHAEDMVGKTDFDLVDESTAAQLAEEQQKVIQSGQPQYGQMEKMHVGQRDLWSFTSRIPVIDTKGQPFGLLVIRRDITELKDAEETASQRAEHILTASEIAREATSTLNINDLLMKAVNLIRERFGYQHASIFLLDSLGTTAVLRESTGEVGQQMLRNNHRLSVGSKSVVGQAAFTGNPVIVNNVIDDPIFLPNPLLPDTRAELAIPLKVGDRVLGALDVQSNQAGIFTQESLGILTILSDQLAVAVTNAELFASTQDMLGKHRLLHQITVAATTAASLDEAMNRVVTGLTTAKITDRAGVMLINKANELQISAISGYDNLSISGITISMGKGIIGLSAESRSAIRITDTLNDPRYYAVQSGTRSEMALPILFGDELMGVLNMESDQVAAFDENDQEIMGALANTLAAIIANTRLVIQIRQQVMRQEMLFSATSKIRRSVDISTILQTSINEIGRAAGASRAKIVLTTQELTPTQEVVELPTSHLKDGQNHNGHNPNGHNNSGLEVK